MTEEEQFALLGVDPVDPPAHITIDDDAAAVEEVPDDDDGAAVTADLTVPTPAAVAAVAGQASSRWSWDSSLAS